MNWPKYACAILETADGRLLLEERPAAARLAARRMTCFGGGRESSESPEECLRRELREELGWEPVVVQREVELWVAGEPMAWFYHALLDVEVDQLQFEPGYEGRLVTPADLAGLPLSPWHAAVLSAWQTGADRVDLPR